MAKKKLSHKERKSQERERKEAMRQHTGWQTSPQKSHAQHLELLAPLLRGNEEAAAQQLLQLLFDSSELADEPELADFVFDPVQTVGHFIKIAETQGWSPDAFYDQIEEELVEAMEEIIVAMLPHLLTQEARLEILDRLDELIERCQEEGEDRKAAQTAVVRMILADRKQKKMWPDVPLFLTLTLRSLEAGFAWMEMVEEINESPPELRPESILNSPVGKKVAGLLSRIPGLRRLAEKKADEVWDEGIDALMRGKVVLGLYNEEELWEAAEIFRTYFGDQETRSDQTVKQNAPSFVEDITALLTRLLTPDLLAEMRQQVETILNSGDLDEETLPFIMLVKEALSADDAPETEKRFFFAALIGEVQHTDFGDDEDEDP
jgi:hypothetical protein